MIFRVLLFKKAHSTASPVLLYTFCVRDNPGEAEDSADPKKRS